MESTVHPDIPRSAVVLLDFIGQVEAPGGYGVIYSNRQHLLATPLTEMTLGEVQAAQPGWVKANGSSAAGRYQVIAKTLAGLVEELHLDPGRRFDADLQDRLGLALLRRRGFDRFASGELPLPDFALALAKEWAAFPVLSAVRGAHRLLEPGETYYAGDGRNRALIAPPTFLAVLQQSLAVARTEAVRRV
jgi:muramidase (phage lysozyme)